MLSRVLSEEPHSGRAGLLRSLALPSPVPPASVPVLLKLQGAVGASALMHTAQASATDSQAPQETGTRWASVPVPEAAEGGSPCS